MSGRNRMLLRHYLTTVDGGIRVIQLLLVLPIAPALLLVVVLNPWASAAWIAFGLSLLVLIVVWRLFVSNLREVLAEAEAPSPGYSGQGL